MSKISFCGSLQSHRWGYRPQNARSTFHPLPVVYSSFGNISTELLPCTPYIVVQYEKQKLAETRLQSSKYWRFAMFGSVGYKATTVIRSAASRTAAGRIHVHLVSKFNWQLHSSSTIAIVLGVKMQATNASPFFTASLKSEKINEIGCAADCR